MKIDFDKDIPAPPLHLARGSLLPRCKSSFKPMYNVYQPKCTSFIFTAPFAMQILNAFLKDYESMKGMAALSELAYLLEEKL